MFRNFSTAATNLNEYFEKIYLEQSVKKPTILTKMFHSEINPQEIKKLKKSIDKELRFYFTAMNEIMNTNLSRKQKEKHLDLIRTSSFYYLQNDDNYDFSENNLPFKEEVLRNVYGKITSIIDGKYKRCLSSLKSIPIMVKIDGVETTEEIAKILNKD